MRVGYEEGQHPRGLSLAFSTVTAPREFQHFLLCDLWPVLIASQLKTILSMRCHIFLEELCFSSLPFPLYSHTYLRLGPAVSRGQRCALIMLASYKPKLWKTSDNMILKPVCEYVQGVTSLLRCRFWQLMLIVSQPQITFDQLPGKKKTGGTQSLLDFSLQDIERQAEVCLCETRLNPANGLRYY